MLGLSWKIQRIYALKFNSFGDRRVLVLLVELRIGILRYLTAFNKFTSLSVRRIAIFTFVRSQSLVYGLYVDQQNTTIDIHLVTHFTDDRRIRAF